MELCERIVAAVDAGQRTASVIALFGVNRTTVTRYRQLARLRQLAPKSIPGRPRQLGTEAKRDLRLQLHLYPDATLGQHCQRWENRHGETPSEATMSREIHRLGGTRNTGRWQPVSAVTTPE